MQWVCIIFLSTGNLLDFTVSKHKWYGKHFPWHTGINLPSLWPKQNQTLSLIGTVSLYHYCGYKNYGITIIFTIMFTRSMCVKNKLFQFSGLSTINKIAQIVII